MSGEKRKRWKKHKTNQVASDDPEPNASPEEGQLEGEPSWIVKRQTDFDSSAPFGHVDAEVKAYFRTVDIQIRDWQDVPPLTSDDQQGLGSSEGLPTRLNG
jgi:nucleolar protein 9